MTQRTAIDAPDAREWLTVKQAAEYAGVSVSSILRWEKAGEIQASRTPGGHRRFRRVDVADLLRAAS